MSANFYTIKTIFRNQELGLLKARWSAPSMSNFILRTQEIIGNNHLTDSEKIDSIVLFLEEIEEKRQAHRRTIPLPPHIN